MMDPKITLTREAVQHLDDLFNFADGGDGDGHPGWSPDVESCSVCREIGEQVRAALDGEGEE